MEESSERYWGQQLALFPGGYRHIMLEATFHLTGSGDTVAVGVIAKDHGTGEWIAAQIPAFTINLRDPFSGLTKLHEFLQFVREQLSPF